MSDRQLYSIGHGTRKIEVFYELLQKYNIEFLIDVRTLPFSRFNPQYNQKALKIFLEENGVRYVFMGDTLGGRPKDPECYTAQGKIDYQKLRERDYFQKGLLRLKTAYTKNVPAAIMCSEKKPQVCHRSLLIGKELEQDKIPVLHIDELGKLKTQTSLATEFNFFR